MVSSVPRKAEMSAAANLMPTPCLARPALAEALALLMTGAGCQHAQAPVYPIGIYGVPTTDDQRIVREAGFNLVAGPANKPYLDSAQRLGLKVLASPGTSAGPGFSAEERGH